MYKGVKSNLKIGTQKLVVTKFILAFMTILILTGCSLGMKEEYYDNRDVIYLGKYYKQQTKPTGKMVVTTHEYFLVFKLLSEDGVATPIKVEVPSGVYNGTGKIDGVYSVPFFRNERDGVLMGLAGETYTVTDYSLDEPIQGSLMDVDFVDPLYQPIK